MVLRYVADDGSRLEVGDCCFAAEVRRARLDVVPEVDVEAAVLNEGRRKHGVAVGGHFGGVEQVSQATVADQDRFLQDKPLLQSEKRVQDLLSC